MGEYEAQVMLDTGASAPWWVTLLLVALPGLLAMTFTIATVIIARRINRADGGQPFTVLRSVLLTIGAGAVWGPTFQYGLQELISELAKTALNWKLIALSPLITGVASVIAYDVLRWYTKSRYPGAYALLSVKHPPPGEDSSNGDLTRMYAAQGDDLTEPPKPRKRKP